MKTAMTLHIQIFAGLKYIYLDLCPDQ